MPQVTVNDIHLHYEISGQGQPLLLIHGLGSSTRDWEPQVAEFSRRYQVIAFDLRGHGQSDKPAGPYTLPMFASDTAGLLRALGVDRAHVVGISLGGCVAFQLAVDCPSVLKTMTIVNSTPSGVILSDDAQKEIDRRVAIVRQMGMRAMGQALAPVLFPKPEHAAQRETFVERWAENNPDAYIEATRSFLGWDVSDRLAAIQCPTLFISADQDYTPVAAKEAFVKRMPAAELVVIPDAHHATPLEKPAEFNAVLARFLDQHG